MNRLLLLSQNPMLFKDKKVILSVVIGIGFLTVLLFLAVFIYSVTSNKVQHKALLTQLSHMDTEINALSQNENSNEFKAMLTDMNNNLSLIKQSIASNAKFSDMEKIAAQIALINQNIEALKKLVADSGNGKEFVDANILPFQVISIDVIAQQPFVSINYDHHVTPLSIGDTVAGWQVTEADYGLAEVEFKNSKGQYVKVNLQG